MPKVKTYKNETAVKKTIRELLDEHGWFHWPAAAGPFGATGVSDRLAFRDGVLMAVEVKFGKNKPTTLQKAFLESIAAETGFGFVVNEQLLPTFEVFLRTFDKACDAVSEGHAVDEVDGATILECSRLLTEMVVAS